MPHSRYFPNILNMQHPQSGREVEVRFRSFLSSDDHEEDESFPVNGLVTLEYTQGSDRDCVVTQMIEFSLDGQTPVEVFDDKVSKHDAMERHDRLIRTIAFHLELMLGQWWQMQSVDIREEVGGVEQYFHYPDELEPDLVPENGYAFRHGFAFQYTRGELFPTG